jgi:histidinol-phosphate phosphatase family protein
MKVSNKQAVFLDRDGVLIKRADLAWQKSHIRLQDNAAAFIRFLNERKVPVLVVTNQGGVVGRGLISEAGVIKLHAIIQERLRLQGAHIDKFYVCPHHPQADKKEYRMECICRKPNIGMLQQAAKEFAFDLKKSYMIGDMTSDILTGKNAAVLTILMETGHAGKDGKYAVYPDYTTKNMKSLLSLFKQHGFIS